MTTTDIVASSPERAAPDGTGKSGTISYLALHQGQLIAGLLLLVVGITGFYFYPGGLIYFILPLPTYLWVSLVPLIVASVFIVRSLVMMERVSLSREGDVLQVETRRLLSRRASFSSKDVRYIEIRHLESKVLRWAATSALFVTSYEIHFKNGADLLGHAGSAPFLLFCFVVVSVALAIYVATPRKFVEIGTDREATFIPLPVTGQGAHAMVDIARLLGFHEQAIGGLKGVHPARLVLEDGLFPLVSGVAFILVGVGLAASASWFFGDIAVPVLVLLGAKWVKDSLLGGKKFVKAGGPGEFRGCAVGLVAKRIQGGNARIEQTIGATSIHPLEMACYFYLMAQAVKYGFRFALWPYLGFNAGYFLLGLLVLVVIFIRWFGVADRCTVDFGTFSMSFDVVPALSLDQCTRKGLNRYLREKVMIFATAFSILKGNKQLAWTWIIFLLFLLAPILYYIISYPPFIF